MTLFLERKGKLRTLHVCSLSLCESSRHEGLRPGFIALLPVYDLSIENRVRSLVRSLIGFGCTEFCFVGLFSEYFHDTIDDQLEIDGCLGIVTTASPNEVDGIQYFIYGAGAGESDLLAMVGDVPKLEEMVLRDFV